jgi:hypothetical protein
VGTATTTIAAEAAAGTMTIAAEEAVEDHAEVEVNNEDGATTTTHPGRRIYPKNKASFVACANPLGSSIVRIVRKKSSFTTRP